MKHPPKYNFPDFFYNPLTYVGVALALTVFIVECFLFALDFLAHGENLYLSLITFIILPVFILLGLVLIPAGALLKRRAVLRGKPLPVRLDLTQKRHRNAVLVFIAGTVVLIIMSLIGSYMAYEYTESTAFCGTMCHQVMDPEYTTYLQSPHARVQCVACHVGSGASYFFKSKFNGVRQLKSLASDEYPRPIPTPLKNLRPVDEICLRCHSPEQEYQTADFSATYHFSGDDGNQEWHLRMLLPVGGDGGFRSGVHNHMYVDRDIYYVSEDDKREKILWIKSEDKKGNFEIFTPPDSPYKNVMPPADKIRKMDCLDCHNRPTHQFVAPYRFLNDALTRGLLDKDIPEIKDAAMEAMSKEYETDEKAMEGIRDSVTAFYKDYNGGKPSGQKIESTIETLDMLYRRNIFPSMKADWKAYPDHAGHLITPGCFRCHNDEFRSDAGKVITRDCDICHVIVEQGPAGAVQKSMEGLDFIHPATEEDWKSQNCDECHTGGY